MDIIKKIAEELSVKTSQVDQIWLSFFLHRRQI